MALSSFVRVPPHPHQMPCHFLPEGTVPGDVSRDLSRLLKSKDTDGASLFAIRIRGAILAGSLQPIGAACFMALREDRAVEIDLEEIDARHQANLFRTLHKLASNKALFRELERVIGLECMDYDGFLEKFPTFEVFYLSHGFLIRWETDSKRHEKLWCHIRTAQPGSPKSEQNPRGALGTLVLPAISSQHDRLIAPEAIKDAVSRTQLLLCPENQIAFSIDHHKLARKPRTSVRG